MTTALSRSLNTVAVRLGLEVGPRAVIRTAHRLGIESNLEPNASIALGTSEVTPLELVSAYVPFANGGVGVQQHIITSVKRFDGKLLYQRKATGSGQVVDLQAVGMMNAMMRETIQSGTGRKAALPGWQAAGKTGTSQDWRDAWFVGYTAALTAGVWLGNDDGSPTLKASGGTMPAEIWSQFMQAALRNRPPSPLPGLPGVEPAPDMSEPADKGSDPLLRAVSSLLNAGRPDPAPPPKLLAVPSPIVRPPPQPAPRQITQNRPPEPKPMPCYRLPRSRTRKVLGPRPIGRSSTSCLGVDRTRRLTATPAAKRLGPLCRAMSHVLRLSSDRRVRASGSRRAEV